MTKYSVILRELSSGREHRISLPCIIGRDKEADLALSDPTISRRHAMIAEIDKEIWVEDLKSFNGVFVNDRKISERTLLKPGDTVQLGDIQLLVSEAEADISEETVVLHSLDREAEWQLDRERLRLIYEITTECCDTQDLKTLVEKSFSRIKEIFRQDRGYLALFQEDGTLRPLFPDPASKSIPLSRSIVERLLQNGESFVLEDALSEPSLSQQKSIADLRIRSALCAPLIYHNQIYGLIYLDRTVPGAYKQEDLDVLRAIAFMLAPLIENTRLWAELKKHYAGAMETLRETEARLIDMERTAAYVALAQAMAHELRNPLMAIGGLVRRIARSESGDSNSTKVQAIVNLVERVEMVLKEVDDFVRIPLPTVKLARIDSLVQGVIEKHDWQSLEEGLPPLLSVNTSNLMVPVDSDLFKKALSMIFNEILLSIPRGSKFTIFMQDFGNELELLVGELGENKRSFEPFSSGMQGKPWSFGLFLNIAHKIICDHGGKILLDPQGHAPFPIIIRMPRTVNASSSGAGGRPPLRHTNGGQVRQKNGGQE
jgi:pSer/pThr/pTyr-binding forkhead associated (FHA) protein